MAEWHFGQGPKYCEACRIAKASCVRTRQCPYHQDPPRSEDGVLTWELFKQNSWRVKTAGLGGVTGFDVEIPRRQLIERGCDPDIADELLAACELGALTAQRERKDEDGQ